MLSVPFLSAIIFGVFHFDIRCRSFLQAFLPFFGFFRLYFPQHISTPKVPKIFIMRIFVVLLCIIRTFVLSDCSACHVPSARVLILTFFSISWSLNFEWPLYNKFVKNTWIVNYLYYFFVFWMYFLQKRVKNKSSLILKFIFKHCPLFLDQLKDFR